MKWHLISEKNPATLGHVTRTTLAAATSLCAAILLGLPEAHWAIISTLVVTQSSFEASLSISIQRFFGTAVGALTGTLLSSHFRWNLQIYIAAVFFIGILSANFKLERAAYRYACITLAIVMIISQTIDPWTRALHRFIEVSLGIIVGLLLTLVWPEQKE